MLDKFDAVLTDVGVYWHWFKALLGNLIWFFLRPCVFFLFFYCSYEFFFWAIGCGSARSSAPGSPRSSATTLGHSSSECTTHPLRD